MLRHTLRERVRTWVDQAYERGPFIVGNFDDDPLIEELEVLIEGQFNPERLRATLDEIRSEYIDQLASRFDSEPLVKKLVLIDQLAMGPGEY